MGPPHPPTPSASSKAAPTTGTTPSLATVYIAPDKVGPTPGKSVFLAGSIEQGAAENWQPRLTETLSDIRCTVFNPRRRYWDSTLEQRASNPVFAEQVNWELDLLDRADVIAMYFDPGTKSPITLLELGLHTKHPEKLVLCCPVGYHRLGNVEMVCARYNIPVLGSYEDLVAEVRKRLQQPEEAEKQ